MSIVANIASTNSFWIRPRIYPCGNTSRFVNCQVTIAFLFIYRLHKIQFRHTEYWDIQSTINLNWTIKWTQHQSVLSIECLYNPPFQFDLILYILQGWMYSHLTKVAISNSVRFMRMTLWDILQFSLCPEITLSASKMRFCQLLCVQCILVSIESSTLGKSIFWSITVRGKLEQFFRFEHLILNFNLVHWWSVRLPN